MFNTPRNSRSNGATGDQPARDSRPTRRHISNWPKGIQGHKVLKESKERQGNRSTRPTGNTRQGDIWVTGSRLAQLESRDTRRDSPTGLPGRDCRARKEYKVFKGQLEQRPRGPQGIQGIQGVQGATGQGAQGIQGIQVCKG